MSYSDSVVGKAADKVDFWEKWEQINNHNPKLVDNLEYHYVAMRNAELAGDTDYDTMASRMFGFNPGDTIEDVLNAVADTAFEMIAGGFPAK